MSKSCQTSSPLAQALRDEDGLPVDLASKYVRAANRKHSVEEQVVLADMSGGAPHGLKPPAFSIQNEKPEHTFIAYKFAQGMSSKQVYESFGGQWNSETNLPISGTGQWSYQALLNIRRQPWFVHRVTNILKDAGLDQITASLKAELPNAIDVVREVLNNEEEKGATRLQAAAFFFDRALGKATQHIKTEIIKGVDDYEDDAAKLREELATIEAEIISINPSQA
tara:strand:- start:2728 stop:3399 length:672 start_codon:yes stop_codon:yes gene_type:complete